MAPNDNDDSQTSSDSDNAFGRLRNPGVGSTEIESHDDEAVEKFSERLRDQKNVDPEEAPEPVDEQDVEDDEVEDLVLDALDSEAQVDPDTDQSAGIRDTDAGLGEADPVDDEQRADQAVDETDTGTGTGVRDRPDREQSGEDDAAGQVCPSCESVSPPGMRFCVQCGESLRDGTGDRATRSSKGRGKQHSSVPTLDRDKLDSQFPTGFELVTINDDGTDGRAIPVRSAKTILGRDGDTRFPTDEFLNPKHARLTIEDQKFFIEDLHSLNGTFLKLRGEVRLQPGDTFLMGRQVLRFEEIEQDFDSKKTSADGTRYMGSPAPGGEYKILQIGVGNIVQNIYCLPDSGVVLGREKGDIIFKDDKFMSGRHARIFTDDEPHLADLNSSNGTWIKLWEKTELKQDDYIFMGQQLFRVELPQ
jgi:pSer/pThr/pTyr-binding forkhead associated (FHA) protein